MIELFDKLVEFDLFEIQSLFSVEELLFDGIVYFVGFLDFLVKLEILLSWLLVLLVYFQ